MDAKTKAYEPNVWKDGDVLSAEKLNNLENGVAAAEGVAGPKGDKGDTGPAGKDGAAGAKGATGPAGKDGEVSAAQFAELTARVTALETAAP